MTLQHFHRFPYLPRELQLHIWDIYEANRTHAVHYFRRLVYWHGLLYGAASEDTGQSLSRRYAIPNPVYASNVLDKALTPDSKILLLEGNDLYVYDLPEPLTACSFRRIQSLDKEMGCRHRWVNFKLDTFCFANERRRDQCRLFFDFFWLQESGSLVTIEELSAGPHWFFQIQKLELLVAPTWAHLGDFDKQLLARHPCLQTVIMVPAVDYILCRHARVAGFEFAAEAGKQIQMERIPLDRVAAKLEIIKSRPTCPCYPLFAEKRLAELLALKQELIDVFSNREVGRRVEVRAEMEVHWCRQRSTVAELIAEAVESDDEAADEEATDEAEDAPLGPPDVSAGDGIDP